MTVGCWWINTPAPYPGDEGVITLRRVFHGFPIPQKDSALVVHWGNSLELFVCDFLRFLFSLLHTLSNVSWSQLPDKPLVLQSLSQGLFLGKSTLRVEKVGV